jgi:hypothetical protein
MTFTEAAIEVLRREGKPLHFKKLSEIAIRENLLDHVGKIPEETMADQLAAHCRLPRPERRLIAVQQGTFALAEWGLEEDPAGHEGLVEPPPEGEPSYRGRERHPIPSRDLARSTGRSDGRPRRREEEERRGRRFPPPAEVAYEILAGAGKPLTVVEIAATGAERLLMPDAFVRDGGSLRAALVEDNRRRESAGRSALFQLDGETVTLVAQPEPGERAVAAAAPPQRPAATLQDVRRTALAALRRRVRECDGPTVEHVALKLLEKLGFRDVKVAKRGREHVVCTGKRRMGLADVRHAIRVLRSGADASRRDVVDMRRDLGHYGAQIGVVLTPGDAARDARGEAGGAGQLPVVLLCGEALAEAFAEAGVGCVPIVVPEVDEAFFRAAAEAAEGEESARRARREERERREAPRADEVAANADAAPRAEAAEPREVPIREVLITDAAVHVEADDGGASDEDDGDEEGPESEGAEAAEAQPAGGEAEPGAPSGERRRRRRRRRRRGGRGRGGKEGPAGAAAGAPGTAEAAPQQLPSGAEAPGSGAPAAEPPAPAPGAGSGQGSGGDGGAGGATSGEGA